MLENVPAVLNFQILNIVCPRCGYSFATASHRYFHKPHKQFVSDISCAQGDCSYYKKAVSYGPNDAMKKVLRIYLNDEADITVCDPEPAEWDADREETDD